MNAFFDRKESLSPQKPTNINLSFEKNRAHQMLYNLIVAATVTIGLSSAKRFEVVQNYWNPNPFRLKHIRVRACEWHRNHVSFRRRCRNSIRHRTMSHLLLGC